MSWTFLFVQLNKDVDRGFSNPTDSNSLYGTISMNIYLAKSLLENLNFRSRNQTLISKLGNKTKYYYELINILNSCNISFKDESIVETKWRIINLDFSEKFCKRCNKSVKFVSLNKGFRSYCSGSCGALHRDKSTLKGWMTDKGRVLRKNTMLERYGVEHQLHVPEIFERQQHKRYKTYSIRSPSGKKFRVQGYERFVIPALWNQYEEDDIIVKKKDLPKIEYRYNEKIKKYYPDCFILSKKIVCEIKSTYAIKSDLLIPKMEATIEAGYIPKVYLYDKENIKILSLDDVKIYLSKL